MLSGSKMSFALYEFMANALSTVLPGVNVLPGERNVKDNPDTVIFCNDPVAIKDNIALGNTFARIEIVNKKQDSGLEYFQTTRDTGNNVVRWGTIDLEEAVLAAIIPIDQTELVIDNYSFNIREVKKGYKDENYTYTWVILNCIIGDNN